MLRANDMSHANDTFMGSSVKFSEVLCMHKVMEINNQFWDQSLWFLVILLLKAISGALAESLILRLFSTLLSEVQTLNVTCCRVERKAVNMVSTGNGKIFLPVGKQMSGEL